MRRMFVAWLVLFSSYSFSADPEKSRANDPIYYQVLITTPYPLSVDCSTRLVLHGSIGVDKTSVEDLVLDMGARKIYRQVLLELDAIHGDHAEDFFLDAVEINMGNGVFQRINFVRLNTIKGLYKTFHQIEFPHQEILDHARAKPDQPHAKLLSTIRIYLSLNGFFDGLNSKPKSKAFASLWELMNEKNFYEPPPQTFIDRFKPIPLLPFPGTAIFEGDAANQASVPIVANMSAMPLPTQPPQPASDASVIFLISNMAKDYKLELGDSIVRSLVLKIPKDVTPTEEDAYVPKLLEALKIAMVQAVPGSRQYDWMKLSETEGIRITGDKIQGSVEFPFEKWVAPNK